MTTIAQSAVTATVSIKETPQITPRFVPPQSGRELWLSGKGLGDCVTENQRQEWLAADMAGFMAYVAEVERAGISYTVIDTLPIRRG